jgi:excisionase family DNA binding protein
MSAVRLALTRAEAAAAIGISLDSFERYVQGDLRLVRRGRLRLVPVVELERWLEREAALTLDERSNGDRVRPT